MSRAAEPAKLSQTRSVSQQAINRLFHHQAGENWTQAPPVPCQTSETQPVVRGPDAHQTTTSKIRSLQINMITYNAEAMSMERLRQITQCMQDENYNVACIQGTRWNVDWSMWSNGYKVFNAPAGKASAEAHAGVSIILSESILQNMKITPTTIIDYRAISIRLHSANFDISITSAYAPGDHSDHKDRNTFWTNLRNYHAKLPTRTYQIIGMDANGHIGRDSPMPHIGNYGATTWTNNGMDLADMTCALKLTATNTIQSCKNTSWTWQSRDGRARARVDYILIPTKGLREQSCGRN